MKRVTRSLCEDGPLLEEQETEGQRQLHSLLLQQLHTEVDIQQCVSKRQCFAPASLYRPFGEQAAGVRSLSQFQALQDGEKELSELRELGLSEAEILLWRNRDTDETTEKSRGVRADPSAKEQRLQQIREKIAARDKILARPQRFNTSRPLSRREMEIEQALFHGNKRQGFLTALYHRDEVPEEDQQVPTVSRSMDSVYKEVLNKDRRRAPKQNKKQEKQNDTESNQSQTQSEVEKTTDQSELESSREEEQLRLAPATQVNLEQPISSLRAGSHVPLTVRGDVQTVSDEEITSNRESDETIRSIPRFRNYTPGKPSQVLCVKNLSAQATVAQMVALFSRFEQPSGPAIVYRLLTGRLKGQAFISLSDVETAQKALKLLHGYRLLGKPLVLEFSREKQDS